MPKACPYAMALSFWVIAPCREIILSSGVFRRETVSGFYPWDKMDSPRKRVAEGLCGWRHGNSFPMTQSAQSHRQMRSIPHCPKAVFYVFVFDSIHNSATLHNLSPSIFPLNRSIRLHGVNHNQPFPTANQELIWSVSSFFLWLLMVKMSDF